MLIRGPVEAPDRANDRTAAGQRFGIYACGLGIPGCPIRMSPGYFSRPSSSIGTNSRTGEKWKGARTLHKPPGYRILDAESLRNLIAALPLREQLGGKPDSWTIEEVGDGNLNLVFLIRGAEGGFAAKQALPYVRLVGESWPLPLSRAHYERAALSRQAELAPGLVPAIHHL